MMVSEVHNPARRLEKAFEHIDRTNLSKKNQGLIREFSNYLTAEGIGKLRVCKYIYALCKIAIMLGKDFPNADKQDIVDLCSKIEKNDGFSAWTKHDYKIHIRRFYKWLREKEGQEFDDREYPNEVKWIKVRISRNNNKLPEELFTKDEILNMADNTNNLRDKALILSLYETGARIGELLSIQIKDLEFDKYGALVTLHGKTGARKIRIIASAPAISNWLLEHPDRKNKNAYLFCGIWTKNRGKLLGYNTVRKILKECAKKARINKPVNPHHFRHSRATELAKNLTEAQLCAYLGWVQGSKEAATYVHLSQRDMDKAILGLHGLVEEKIEKETTFKPIVCPRCQTTNSPGSKFCSSCSLGLDLKTVMNFEKTKDDITSNIVNLIQDKDQAMKTLEALTKLLQDE